MRGCVRISGWVLGMAVGWVSSCQGWVPVLEEGVEYRFAGGRVEEVWRAQRPRIERLAGSARDWVRVTAESGTRQGWIGNRVAVRVIGNAAAARGEWERLGLRWSRTGAGGIQILQARDPWAAAWAAAELSRGAGSDVAMPVMRRGMAMHGRYAPRPTDPFFPDQWHLENRDGAGRSRGPDLHIRSAWPVTQGEGVTVAICDDGFETDHPDLSVAAAKGAHFDFILDATGTPVYGSHATCVAGLVGALDSNGMGVSGVSPMVGLASWAIFDALGLIASDEALMDVFQNRIDEVAVQNHSWGNTGPEVSLPTAMEAGAISNASENGRGGRGVVFVRSGGNERESGNNVNDDGYANDPRVIAVAAVRDDGRTASYSNPGACLLVGAPSGDDSDTSLPSEGVATTDRVGTRGYNRLSGTDSRADYALGSSGFSGTSASAPQISGVVALILGANPGLTYRDVQQVLVNSARHHDRSDPDLVTNGAGYEVSHNAGFGVPDSGQAVRLAERWFSRPERVTVTVTHEEAVMVPDDGLRVRLTQGGIPSTSLACEPSAGPHPDEPTASLPLIHVGQALGPLTEDLTGKAALIERGGSFFWEKLERVKAAGAGFGVFYNNVGTTELTSPAATDFVGIPSVFISANDGLALLARLDAGEVVEAQLRLDGVRKSFVVSESLVCEHVGLRVRSTHRRRGDLRITLVSPTGTRSILQHRNVDGRPGPVDWTYWSTHHFYEPSVGTWHAEFTDQAAGMEGEVEGVDLIVWGVAIEDSDGDGLDDAWERQWFGDLDRGARDDGDGDGSCNAREQVLGTDPTKADEPFRIDVAPYDPRRLRLSWPGSVGFDYRVRRNSLVEGTAPIETVIPGRFPEVDFVIPSTAVPGTLFQVEAIPR